MSQEKRLVKVKQDNEVIFRFCKYSDEAYKRSWTFDQK